MSAAVKATASGRSKSRSSKPAIPLEDISSCCAGGLCVPISQEDAERLATVLKAVADPVRLRMLSLIKSCGEACVCDLNDAVGLSQPTVSHHLKILTEAGLLHREQRGTWAWFRVDEDRLTSLSELFAS